MKYVKTLESEGGTRFDVFYENDDLYFEWDLFKRMCTAFTQNKLEKLLQTFNTEYPTYVTPKLLISLKNFRTIAKTQENDSAAKKVLRWLDEHMIVIVNPENKSSETITNVSVMSTPTDATKATSVADIELQIKKLKIGQEIRQNEYDIKELEISIKNHELDIAKAKIRLEC